MFQYPLGCTWREVGVQPNINNIQCSTLYRTISLLYNYSYACLQYCQIISYVVNIVIQFFCIKKSKEKIIFFKISTMFSEPELTKYRANTQVQLI